MRLSFLFAPLCRAAVAGAALCMFATAPLAGQSLLADRGLGLVVQPQGARSTGLGGTSLGLPGAEISWTNPAGAVGLPAAGLLVSFQYDDFEGSLDGRATDGSTARFPLLLAAFPFGERWALSAGFGGFLDQNAALEREDTLFLGSDTLAVRDRLASEGGVSRLRLGGAYRLLPQLSVGAGLDLFTGGVRRAAGRIFPGEAGPRCCFVDYRYSGTGLLGSVDWNPSAALSLSVSATTGGSLEAEGDSVTPTVDYDLPVQLAGGASARVSANTLLAGGAEWAGWSALDGRLVSVGGGRDSWAAHGGIEYDGVQLAGRPLPLRLGGRFRQLPFRTDAGAEWVDERAITGGVGVVLGGGATSTDFAVERGWRGGAAAGVDERFWRLVLSVTVLGQ